MTTKNEPNGIRRGMLASLGTLPLAGNMAVSSATTARAEAEKPVLVAYFSRSGNTRVVAGLIQRATDADLFEILPAAPYPDEYLATVEQAKRERDRGDLPALKAKVPSLERYKTIFLGMPIWGETTPSVVRSFLSAHDLTGKTLIPFITHGGYGLGSSEQVIARLASNARIRRAFSMQADQERQTMNTVNGWLGQQSPSSK